MDCLVTVRIAGEDLDCSLIGLGTTFKSGSEDSPCDWTGSVLVFPDEYNVLTRLPVHLLRSLFGAVEFSYESRSVLPQRSDLSEYGVIKLGFGSRSVLPQRSDLSEFGMITLGFEPGNLFADRQVPVLEPPQGVLLVRS